MPERLQRFVPLEHDIGLVPASAADFLGDRFNAQIMGFEGENRKRCDPKQRAISSAPGIPAIFVEQKKRVTAFLTSGLKCED